MDFSYDSDKTEVAQTAYETLIPRRHARRCHACSPAKDEVEAENGKLMTPIEDAWASMPPSKFPNYAAGSDGPAESDENGEAQRTPLAQAGVRRVRVEFD